MATNGHHGYLDPDAARALRRDLKCALAGFSNGKVGLGELLHQIELVVKQVAQNPKAMMARSKGRVARFVGRYAPNRANDTGMPGVNFETLYAATTEARNDFTHTGTQAALAGVRTTAMATVLMEALAAAAKGENGQEIHDIMVSNPMCAHEWQSLADVRRTMLVNDYSVLPISNGYCGDKWKCIRAEELAMHLRGIRGEPSGKTLGESTIEPMKATTVKEEALVECILTRLGDHEIELPVVVTRQGGRCGKSHLVGLVTAFDLL